MVKRGWRGLFGRRLFVERLESRLAPATYTVTNLNNTGAGSLRNALALANANANSDTIVFSVGLSGTITLSSELPIDFEVDIIGPSNKAVTISGNNAVRIFNLTPLGDLDTVFISNLTLEKGNTTQRGGAIFAKNGALTLQNCLVRDSFAALSGGGIGVFNDSASGIILRLEDCVVSDNSTTGLGGGISVYGSGASPNVTIQDCSILSNTANSDGGGLSIEYTNQVRILTSTIAKNKSGFYGGGLLAYDVDFEFELSSVTLSENSAVRGGGIAVLGKAQIDYSTITDNSASGDGGGVFVFANFDPTTFESSIISGNTASKGTDIYDLTGNHKSVNCAIGSSQNLVGSMTGNLPYGTNLKLGALANNGGGRLTHFPAANSPVIDYTITSFVSGSFDGRGAPRLSNGALDIGAIEITNTTYVVTNTKNLGPGSLRAMTSDASNNMAITPVTFDPVFFATPRTIVVEDNILDIRDCSVVGPGADLLTITATGTGNRGVRVINADLSGVRIYKADGVFANGDSLLTNVFIESNTGPEGSGIEIGSSANVTIINCTIANNSATDGGGIKIDGSFTTLRITNSTISNNTATGSGGGIFNADSSNDIIIYNTTITGNSAGTGGGGLFNSSSSTAIHIESTICSGNLCVASPDIKSNGAVTARRSAIGSATGFTLTDLGDNLAFHAFSTLKLGPLLANGGPMPTHVFTGDSPLLNAGNNAKSLTQDQRGGIAVRVANGAADIGAVELQNFIVTNIANGGAGSLRGAIANASIYGGADSVSFDPTVFSSAKTITIQTSELVIGGDVNIIGPTSRVTVDGNGLGRVFNLMSAPANTVIQMSNLIITGGSVTGSGGGLLIEDEVVTMIDCDIVGNFATVRGGGIYHASFVDTKLLTLQDCTIADNFAGDDGGGIFSSFNGRVNMANSTISGNISGDKGGGIYFGNLSVTSNVLTLNQTTISGNFAAGQGGGVFSESTGIVSVVNSTITDNQSSVSNGGGGISSPNTGILFLESSIVAGNKATGAPDIAATKTVNAYYSAIGSNNGFTISGAKNLAFGVNLKLGALANNGGSTKTHLPAADSPVIGVGSNPTGTSNDQRGVGYGRMRNGTTDIGAIEARDPFVVININDTGKGSLRQAALDANAYEGADTIAFSTTFFNVPRTITLTSGKIALTDHVVINGTGANLVTIAGTSSTHVFTSFDFAGQIIEFNKLTLTKGVQAIRADKDFITLNDCVVTGNTGAVGAGIYMDGGVGSGFFGWLTLNRTTVTGNTALNNGGGVYMISTSFTANDSILSNNTATNGDGGAISFFGTPSLAGFTIRNSTISSNKAADVGGGLRIWGTAANTGTILIQNSTITANTGGINRGGGIGQESGETIISLESSIVFGNSGGAVPDIFAANKVNAKNSSYGLLIGFAVNDLGGNLTPGTNPQLGALANNGGPTMTHALAASSPARGKGFNPAGLTTDQRGTGFTRNFFDGVDIGAFEYQAPPAFPEEISINNGEVQRSRVTSILITFTNPPLLPPNPADAFTLNRQSDGSVVSLVATPSGNSVELTFVGGVPFEFGSLADGRYSLHIDGDDIINLDANDDGKMGDDLFIIGTPANGLFRLFGDSDGNGSVSAIDFNAFRLDYGTTGVSIFDFDGNGSVSAADFNAFRLRYGVSIAP